MLKTYRGEHTVSQKDDELLSAREVEVAKKEQLERELEIKESEIRSQLFNQPDAEEKIEETEEEETVMRQIKFQSTGHKLLIC